MRFLSSITLLTLLSQAFSLPPHRYEIRQLVEDRALEISEACVNATETLREHEDLATVLATTTAEVEDILFAGCEGSGNTLICQSDIEASVSSLDEFKAACASAGGYYNTTSFAFGCSGWIQGERVNFQFKVDNDFNCFASVCDYDEIVEEMAVAFEQGMIAVESEFSGMECSSSVNSGGVSVGRAALALASMAASAVMML